MDDPRKAVHVVSAPRPLGARPPVTATTLLLTFTQAERSALLQVLEVPFCGDSADLATVVGSDNLRAARSMRSKLLAELERTRRMGQAP